MRDMVTSYSAGYDGVAHVVRPRRKNGLGASGNGLYCSMGKVAASHSRGKSAPHCTSLERQPYRVQTLLSTTS